MGWQRWLRRRGRYELPEGWEEIVATRVRHWHLLDDDERARLTDLMVRLLRDKSWEAAHGFELTDEMRLTIASQACLLILELDYDYYRNVRSILVHPTTMTLTGQRRGPVSGVVDDSPLPILGQAQDRRWPLVVAWDAARRDARHPERGHNVVFHEFAHKLDMLDDVIDGTPPLPDDASQQRWVEVCTTHYEALRDGRGGHLLRDYAGVNPGEFFAVATEVFFDRPVELQEHKRDLYEVLQAFYRQDPAARALRAAHPEASRGD